jgi:hypothetical protein
MKLVGMRELSHIYYSKMKGEMFGFIFLHIFCSIFMQEMSKFTIECMTHHVNFTNLMVDLQKRYVRE